MRINCSQVHSTMFIRPQADVFGGWSSFRLAALFQPFAGTAIVWLRSSFVFDVQSLRFCLVAKYQGLSTVSFRTHSLEAASSKSEKGRGTQPFIQERIRAKRVRKVS